MNSRLLQFLAAENISQSQFADTIGVARASVSHIIAGRNRPGYDFITSVMKHYPSLNVEWLLAGKGKMYKTSDKSSEIQNVAAPQLNKSLQVEDSAKKEEIAETSLNSSVMDVAESSVDLFSDYDEIESKKSHSVESSLPEPNPIPTSGNPVRQSLENAAVSDVPVSPRSISKIVVFYSDGTFKEIM